MKSQTSAPHIPFLQKLALPVIAAPMFLVSGPALVIAACKAGLVGSFPAPNARTLDDLERWCEEITSALQAPGHAIEPAPWAMNVIAHASYTRLDAELKIIGIHKPGLVITALGNPAAALKVVHSYGGLVFADVATVAQARKSIAIGADGLVLLCAGAGGHTGIYNPFAFVREVRQFWNGPLVLSGGIADAAGIRAAEVLGADLVYMGTRFIAAAESLVSDDYRKMVVEASLEDIVTSAAITGVSASWMKASLVATGWTPDKLASAEKRKPDFSGDIGAEGKAWKNVWSAGQGVGLVNAIAPVADIVAALKHDYDALRARGN
ncbi:MAG: nitronate monooxygenase [Pseudomonadota bacterium]